MRAMTWLAIALGWAVPAATLANTPIQIAAADAYRHEPGAVTVPAVLDGLPRVTAVNIGATPMVDVGLDYRTPDGREVTTVYIFRQALGSPEVWFDRARLAIIANRQIGTLQPAPTEMFVLPGARVPNGLRAIHAAEGGPVRSTAVALVPVDGWMIKLRLSSATLDKDALRGRLERTIAAIGWPSFAKARPRYPMTPCAEPLSIAKPANPAKLVGDESMAAGMLDALVAGAGAKQPEESEGQATPVRWCRDAITTGGAGIYRRNEEKDNYILALGDGGIGMTVGPSLSNLLGKGNKSWSVSLVQLERQVIFAPYDDILQPQQAVALLQTGKPVSAAATWPKTGAITLIMPPK
jgi:hypothetical protein